MSAFAIFAVVLTFAYAIYYAVVIFLDMTRTEGQKSELEDIDIPGMASKVPDEPPTEVLETENGGYTIPKTEGKADTGASEQPKSEPAKEQPTPQQPSKGADSADKPASSTTSNFSVRCIPFPLSRKPCLIQTRCWILSQMAA